MGEAELETVEGLLFLFLCARIAGQRAHEDEAARDSEEPGSKTCSIRIAHRNKRLAVLGRELQ
jgi:hypothetical protein